MRIEIKQKHIEKGMPDNGIFCPIALALDDVLPRGWTASAHYDRAFLHNRINGKKVMVKFPRSVQRFIKKFDKSKTMNLDKELKPFSFRLDLNLEKL